MHPQGAGRQRASTPARRPASRPEISDHGRRRTASPSPTTAPACRPRQSRACSTSPSGCPAARPTSRPTRGAQGNALKTIVAMPFVLDGERGRVEIEAARHPPRHRLQGRPHPPGAGRSTLGAEPSDVRTGTTVRVLWPQFSHAQFCDDAEARFLQIAADYAWLNPHAYAHRWTGSASVRATPATDPAWAKWKPSDPTSPHWYTRGAPRAADRRLHRP